MTKIKQQKKMNQSIRQVSESMLEFLCEKTDKERPSIETSAATVCKLHSCGYCYKSIGLNSTQHHAIDPLKRVSMDSFTICTQSLTKSFITSQLG